MAQHVVAADADAVPDGRPVPGGTVASDPSRADLLMRRLLRVEGVDRRAGRPAHKAFRLALVFTAARCLISYLVIPLAVPALSFAGAVATPLSLALCALALVNGVVSVRRFWLADHRARWWYTGFMAVVFVVLGVAVGVDIATLAGR